MVAVVKGYQVSLICVWAILISGHKLALFCLCASQVRVEKNVFADMADNEVGVGAMVDSRLLVKLDEIAFFLQVTGLSNGIDEELRRAAFLRVGLLKDDLYFVRIHFSHSNHHQIDQISRDLPYSCFKHFCLEVLLTAHKGIAEAVSDRIEAHLYRSSQLLHIPVELVALCLERPNKIFAFKWEEFNQLNHFLKLLELIGIAFASSD